MKKNCIICLILSLVLFICASPLSVMATEADASVTNGCHAVDAAMALSTEERMTATANAVILYELNSQTMLYKWNADERIYPTSMVKLMTVLVALENVQLTDEVTVTRHALDSVAIGSVSAGLKSGEVLTVKDLIYCIMVASANDASAVLAEYVAGNQEQFVQMMNDKAAQLGCVGTNYTNVHGLHDENTYTTARDLCRITEAALQNEDFKTAFTTAKYTLAATNKNESREIHTTNYMMKDSTNKKYPDERVTGGKTGATNQGGRCLILTAESGGMELLCIVMGAKATANEDGSLSAFGSFEESKVLLDYAFDNFEYRQVFFDGQSISQYPVVNGANDVVTKPAQTVSSLLPKEFDATLLRWSYQLGSGTITAPVSAGQELGSVQLWYGDKCLAQTKMVAMHGVPVKTAPIIPEHPSGISAEGFRNTLLILAGILIGMVLLGIVIVLVMRYSRVLKRTLRHKQKRRR